jgi:hypothetical protein
MHRTFICAGRFRSIGDRSKPKRPHNFGPSFSTYCQCYYLHRNGRGLFLPQPENRAIPLLPSRQRIHPTSVNWEAKEKGSEVCWPQQRRALLKQPEQGYTGSINTFLRRNQSPNKGKLKASWSTPQLEGDHYRRLHIRFARCLNSRQA